MVIVILAIVSIGIVAAGMWRWHRKVSRIRSDVAIHPPAGALERKTDGAEKSASEGGGGEDGSEESGEYLQRDRNRAGEPWDGGQRDAKISSIDAAEQASSSVVVEGEQDVSAIEASAEDGSKNVGEAEHVGEGIAHRDIAHTRNDARKRSEVYSDELGGKRSKKTQGDGKIEPTDDGTSIDGGADGGAGRGHEVPMQGSVCPEDDRATDAQMSEEIGVEVKGKKFGVGDDPVGEDAPASHLRATREEDAGTDTWADSEADEWGGKVTSAGASRAEDLRPEIAAASERTAGDRGRRGLKPQLRGEVENSVGGEASSARGEPVETDVLASDTLPTREGDPGTEATAEAKGEDGSENKDAAGPLGERVRREAQRNKKPAVYKDRRGLRRAADRILRNEAASRSPPAEARFRLLLDPVRRSASLSVVLTRPEGFPERIQPLVDGEGTVEAFDGSRYDDLNLAWTGDLLDGELRILSKEGKQWLRSARAIHIFEESAAESGMISVGAARPGVPHAIVCRADDEETVRAAALATGAPPLVSHPRWYGIPDGWAVLSGYHPRHTATSPMPIELSQLDPGTAVEISLSGGLAIRAAVYAEGRPPRIGIAPLPDGASVTIGGVPAKQASDGAWEASGWDNPGHHLIDVVPGPSLSYQIMPDPTSSGEWRFWDAYPGRFGEGSREPWARAEICGSVVRGSEGEAVIAAVSHPVLIALGERGQAVSLIPRGDVAAAVAVVSESPAFLVVATGQRRQQGQIIWLGSSAKRGSRSSADRHWAQTVRSIAARRLPIDGGHADGERAWRNAKQRARRIWRRQ